MHAEKQRQADNQCAHGRCYFLLRGFLLRGFLLRGLGARRGAFFSFAALAFFLAGFAGLRAATGAGAGSPRNCSRIAGLSSVDTSWVISSPRAS